MIIYQFRNQKEQNNLNANHLIDMIQYNKFVIIVQLILNYKKQNVYFIFNQDST